MLVAESKMPAHSLCTARHVYSKFWSQTRGHMPYLVSLQTFEKLKRSPRPRGDACVTLRKCIWWDEYVADAAMWFRVRELHTKNIWITLLSNTTLISTPVLRKMLMRAACDMHSLIMNWSVAPRCPKYIYSDCSPLAHSWKHKRCVSSYTIIAEYHCKLAQCAHKSLSCGLLVTLMLKRGTTVKWEEFKHHIISGDRVYPERNLEG